MFVNVTRIKRNDRVLYEFCDVRRKMMGYLRNNFETVSKDDYLSLRGSLDLLNNNIRYFDHYKMHIFNVNLLIRMIKNTRDNIAKMEEFKVSNNKEILGLISDFEKSFLIAFFIFTPLFKTKLCISLILFLLSISIKAAMYFSKEYARKIKNAITAIEIIQEKRTCYAM
jgi:hypothetical protein